MNKKFWDGKTVLITGHTGFKGSWLSIWLQKLNVNLIGISKSIPTNPSMYELAKVEKGLTSILGDIRDYNVIFKAINKNNPDIIIHMAAQSILRESYENPIETYETNIMGTINVLEAIKNNGKSCIVLIITSDKCYENTVNVESHVESDPMGGYDPYSCSKGCAELVTTSYRNSYFNPKNFENHKISLASARAGNVIGGGDWSRDRLIVDCIKSWVKNKKVLLRSPNATRPWQHVIEPLSGYLHLGSYALKSKYLGEPFNFGPLAETNRTVLELVKEMSETVQFIFITHNKITMEMANQLLGVTMHEAGVSRIVAVDIDEAAELAAM